MVNLIPPAAKKGVVVEYWLRVLTVWSLLFSAIAVLVAISLLPVYVLVEAKIDAYQESADAASQKIATFANVSADLSRASDQARIIIEGSRTTSLAELITLFDSLEKPGVSYTQVVIKTDETGMRPVTVKGVAEDRQTLSDFRDRLLAEPTIDSVDFPISNLAKESDIVFTITVELNLNAPSS